MTKLLFYNQWGTFMRHSKHGALITIARNTTSDPENVALATSRQSF